MRCVHVRAWCKLYDTLPLYVTTAITAAVPVFVAVADAAATAVVGVIFVPFSRHPFSLLLLSTLRRNKLTSAVRFRTNNPLFPCLSPPVPPRQSWSRSPVQHQLLTSTKLRHRMQCVTTGQCGLSVHDKSNQSVVNKLYVRSSTALVSDLPQSVAHLTTSWRPSGETLPNY